MGLRSVVSDQMVCSALLRASVESASCRYLDDSCECGHFETNKDELAAAVMAALNNTLAQLGY